MGGSAAGRDAAGLCERGPQRFATFANAAQQGPPKDARIFSLFTAAAARRVTLVADRLFAAGIRSGLPQNAGDEGLFKANDRGDGRARAGLPARLGLF